MEAKLKPGHCAGELIIGDTKITDGVWVEVPEKIHYRVMLRVQFGEVEIRETAEAAGTPVKKPVRKSKGK